MTTFNPESIGVPSRCGACLSRALIGVMDANADGDAVQWIYCSACGQRSPAYKAGDKLMFGDWFAVQQVYRRVIDEAEDRQNADRTS